jgi:microcystin degradation protein MlrC
MPRSQWLEVTALEYGHERDRGGCHEVGTGHLPGSAGAGGILGSVERSSFEAKLNELVRQIRPASPKFDGAILVMHGAMLVDGYPQGDAEVAKRVCAAMGGATDVNPRHFTYKHVRPDLFGLN